VTDWVDMNTQVEQRLGQNRTVTCRQRLGLNRDSLQTMLQPRLPAVRSPRVSNLRDVELDFCKVIIPGNDSMKRGVSHASWKLEARDILRGSCTAIK